MTDEATDPRRALRAILEGGVCVSPASVYDPLTARAAGLLGFPLAMLGGSIAALAVLGAPDHTLLSLDEFAGLARRIVRAGGPPLFADADHGFGNAMNAMRCTEELEQAGVAGFSLEDTILPEPFGGAATAPLPLDEACGKLAAALAARRDTTFVIAARTDARLQSQPDLAQRVARYAATGADAIFLTGVRRVEEVETAREAAGGLPLILAAARGELEGRDLANLGVRICLAGHATLPAALDAAWSSLSARAGKDAPPRPDDLMATLSHWDAYRRRIETYLRPRPASGEDDTA